METLVDPHEEEEDPDEPIWDYFERRHGEEYEEALGDALELGVPLVICGFCHRPTRLCDC